MQRKEIKRGDLFYYDFGTREGSIQSGVRPVLVVQADDYNRNAPTIIVACLTAVIKKRYLPSHIILGEDLGGGQVDDEIMRYRDKLIRQAQNLPIWERKCLTVDEAAEYSGIGRKKLRSLLKKKNCPFALSDGFQLLIIREKLDEYCKKHKRI